MLLLSNGARSDLCLSCIAYIACTVCTRMLSQRGPLPRMLLRITRCVQCGWGGRGVFTPKLSLSWTNHHHPQLLAHRRPLCLDAEKPGVDPGFFSGWAQQSFDPKGGGWAQNLLKIGVFPLKLPENCMILKKSWGKGGPGPCLDPPTESTLVLVQFSISKKFFVSEFRRPPATHLHHSRTTSTIRERRQHPEPFLKHQVNSQSTRFLRLAC